MFRIVTMAVTFGAGYVMGTKAGRERYQQIKAAASDLYAQPAVQKATGAVTEKVSATAADLTAQAKEKAAELAQDAKESVKAAADEPEPGTSGGAGPG